MYDPAGLSVQNGEIVAAMMAYGPDDSHASGPSVPLTVRWRFDGQELRAGLVVTGGREPRGNLATSG